MKSRCRVLILAGVTLGLGSIASAQQPFVQIPGAPCATPPVLHCPDNDCPSDRVINQGPVVEMKTRRTYFLDYPCDLKPDEKVTFILSLHGAGSYGNWQRNYFPIMDYKDSYRLVIATPNSPTHVWSRLTNHHATSSTRWSINSAGEHQKFGWSAIRRGHDLQPDRAHGFFRIASTGGPGRWATGTNPGRTPSPSAALARRPSGARALAGVAPAGRGQRRRCVSFRPATSRLSTRLVNVKWTRKACPRPRSRPRSSTAARDASWTTWWTRRPATSTTALVRTRRIRPGGCCRDRGPRTRTSIRDAKRVAWLPPSFGSRKTTPKDWNRTSPRGWSN